MPPLPPRYATLAEVGAAIQSRELDEFFFVRVEEDGLSCRLRYNNPNRDDNYNDQVNATCQTLFQWKAPDPRIFDQLVSFGIPTKANTVRTGEAVA